MSYKLSHAKDVIGLLEAGYFTHIPIAFTSIKASETGGTEIINVKGRNVASIYKSQVTVEIDFRGLVPVLLSEAGASELQAQNTLQLLTIVAGRSVPVSMVVATVNTDDRGRVDVNELFRPRVHADADVSVRDTDVLYIASGYLDEVHIVAEAGSYVEVRSILRADEIFVGGLSAAWLGEDRIAPWNYLS